VRAMYLQAAAFLFLLIPQRGMGQFLEPDCGVPSVGPTISPRIMGGDTTQITSHPWMASLRVDSQHICGGTLINRKFVLTAAHCIADSNRIKVRLGGYGTATSVQSGKCLLLSEDFDVEFALISSQYNSVYQEYDFGLLKLNRRVEYKDHILPICIVLDKNWRQYIDNIMYLTGTGWGRTEDEGDSGLLRTVDLRRQSQDTCRYHTNGILMSNQFCAGNWDSNLCNGDSGGPVGALVPHGNGHRFIQIGIASFTNTQCEKASVFTDLLSHVDWILRVYRLYGN
ncbi:hypothetical protein KR009_006681, partial [Drosophila setifemur]